MSKRDEIIVMGVKLALKKGFQNLSTKEIARALKIARSLIFYYFNGLEDFKNEIMQYAIDNKILSLIAEGVILKNSHAMKISDDLKKKAFDSMKK